MTIHSPLVLVYATYALSDRGLTVSTIKISFYYCQNDGFESQYTIPGKNYGISTIRRCSFCFLSFYVAVNKLIRDKTKYFFFNS